MNFPPLHSWHLTPSEARRLQLDLAPRLILQGGPRSPRLIAGADVAYLPALHRLVAAVVLLRRPRHRGSQEWELVEQVLQDGPATFPYVPGLLSFREAPLVLECFAKLKEKPELVLVDGQGIAHPRGFGLASHLGLWLDLPTVGCAKSRLVGEYEEPGSQKGEWSRLLYGGKVIGGVLRTRDRVKPLFISPGHKVGITQAVRLALLSTSRYRLPEPTRTAHRLAAEQKRRLVRDSKRSET
ncbi:MAG: deoxyribonuclease V [Planctomycetes bacterium]|nr:deoxyribonuclease V [Planctomycetota bacterium]